MKNGSAWHNELPDWARPRGYGVSSYDRGFLTVLADPHRGRVA